MTAIDLLTSLNDLNEFKSILTQSEDPKICQEALHLLINAKQSKSTFNKEIISLISKNISSKYVINAFVSLNENGLQINGKPLEWLDIILSQHTDKATTEVFTRASSFGYYRTVKEILKAGKIDPGADNNLAIGWASANGHLAVVQALLKDPRVDPSTSNNWVIQLASENGHHEVVQALLKDSRVDPSARNNWAIRYASRNGHFKVVQALLKDPRVDPSADDNYTIRYASENGYLQVVRLLTTQIKVIATLDSKYYQDVAKAWLK